MRPGLISPAQPGGSQPGSAFAPSPRGQERESTLSLPVAQRVEALHTPLRPHLAGKWGA